MKVKFRWVGLNRKFNEIQINDDLTTQKIMNGSYLSFFSESNRGEMGNCKFLSEDIWAGFKDKNGKDAYENDIVKSISQGYTGTFKIHFRNNGAPMFILYPAWQNIGFWNIHASEYKKGKKFLNVDGKIWVSDIDAFVDDGIEIIGNIYETPELLPKSTA